MRPLFSPAVPQLFADVDKDKVLKQGVALSEVYNALQTFLGGSYVNDFSRFGRQWKVFVQAEGAVRTSPEDIRKFYVRNLKGDMVPLSSFVTVRAVSGPEYTVRFNLYRSVEIQGVPASGYSSGQALQALEEVAQKTLPPEMGYAWNGLSYQEKASQGGSARVLGLSLVFVFLILAALYESWSLPFSVLLSVPVAVLGAFLGLFIAALGQQRVRADRPSDARRLDREERDPDRRIRARRARQGQIDHRRRPGRRAPPIAGRFS